MWREQNSGWPAQKLETIKATLSMQEVCQKSPFARRRPCFIYKLEINNKMGSAIKT